MELEINELLNQESENDNQSQEQNDLGEVIENDIKIPKRIFQTHKTIEYIQSKPKLQRAMNSWRRYVPEFGYHFYTDEMCALYVHVNHFKKNVTSLLTKSWKKLQNLNLRMIFPYA